MKKRVDLSPCTGAKLRLHEPTVARMRQSYEKRGVELNEARLRMATLPDPADEVLFTPDLWVPLVVLQGVYILPGIPNLFRRMVSAHQVCVGPKLASAKMTALARADSLILRTGFKALRFIQQHFSPTWGKAILRTLLRKSPSLIPR